LNVMAIPVWLDSELIQYSYTFWKFCSFFAHLASPPPSSSFKPHIQEGCHICSVWSYS
jgi:hypothetical protein